jgi:hypothetical protein
MSDTESKKRKDDRPDAIRDGKSVKIDPTELLEKSSTMKSTEKWLGSSEKDKESFGEERRRDCQSEARTDARYASAFAQKHSNESVDTKVALLDLKILTLERNVLYLQDWLGTFYDRDGNVSKPGWISVRSSANTGCRLSLEESQYLQDQTKDATEKKPVAFTKPFKPETREEWLEKRRAQKQGGGKRDA